MVIGLPLASVMGFRPDPVQQQQQLTREEGFSEELRTRMADSSGRSPVSAPELPRTSERQDPGAAAGIRQAAPQTVELPVANDAPARPPVGESNAPSITPIRASLDGSVFQLENPIPKVTELLTKMGIDVAGIQFERLDDAVSNPLGAGHVNHLMRVKTSNGWKEDYAVEYILRGPSITANEIAAQARRPEAPPHLRGV